MDVSPKANVELELISDDDAPDAPAWQSGLIRNEKGTPKGCLANAIHALTMSLEWRGVLALNSFDGNVVKLRRPPMRDTEVPAGYELGEWNDTDSSLACAWLSRKAGVHIQPQMAGRAVYAVAQQNKFHPVTSYIDGLKWDGKVRLLSWLSRYMGAEQTTYTEAVGVRWLISAVARVYEPGCKADHALVLEGKQGTYKSTAIEVLASAPWYSDTTIIFGEKDSYEALRGVWIHEMAELAAFRRSEVEAQKAFISKKQDRYRRPYGEGQTTWKRQTVFVGTTNDDRYLVDPTGNRRFWPVKCGSVDIAALRADRDQIWAEALVRYQSGEVWHLDSVELVREAAQEQDDRVHPDDWETIIHRWLESERGQLFQAKDTPKTCADILEQAIGMEKDRIDKGPSSRVGRIMAKLGWASRRGMVNGMRVHTIVPPAPKQAELGLPAGE